MRLVLRALALVAGLAAAPAALAVPVVIYPLDRAAADEDVGVVQSLVEAAVHHAARRSSVRPADPLFAPARCGPSGTASPACLAGFAGAGLVVRAGVRRASGILVVTLEAVTADGRVYGPVGVGLEIVIQNAEPLTRALLYLVDKAEGHPPAVAQDRGRGAPATAAPAPKAHASAPAAPRPAPAVAAVAGLVSPVPLPPAPPPPVPIAPAASGPARSSVLRSTAPWVTACGLALAGVGGMYAASNQTLTNKLERKRAAGTLTEADMRWYRTSDQYTSISKTLLIAGGGVTAAGLALWALAPTVEPTNGGVRVGVAGRF